MELWEAMEQRHSVRRYTGRNIGQEAAEKLAACVTEANRQSGLHIQLCLDEPLAFSGLMAKYGSFRNVRNYFALVGSPGPDLEEKCGYYGEKLVLRSAQLGLNTCWVALTYRKGKAACTVAPGEKLCCVIALGYGESQGVPHKNKPLEALCKVEGGGSMPEWFRRGAEAARMAPTAMNQQKFLLTLSGDAVAAEPLKGAYTKLDLGIVKYHFEVGAGEAGWRWA